MMLQIREYFGSWKFLVMDIPRGGFRAFLVSYMVFCLLALLVLAEGGKANLVDQMVSNWVHARPVLRGKWSQEVTRFGGNEYVMKLCWASVAFLLFLRRWEYAPALLIGVLGDVSGGVNVG